MTKPKYLAPPPWSYVKDNQWTNAIAIVDADGGHVAILTRGYEGEMIDGNREDCPSWTNARVIAAAPAMLRVLKMFMETDGHDEFEDVWPDARTALAAATEPSEYEKGARKWK